MTIIFFDCVVLNWSTFCRLWTSSFGEKSYVKIRFSHPCLTALKIDCTYCSWPKNWNVKSGFLFLSNFSRINETIIFEILLLIIMFILNRKIIYDTHNGIIFNEIINLCISTASQITTSFLYFILFPGKRWIMGLNLHTATTE